VRELWARALDLFESWREPMHLAETGFWVGVLGLYALIAASLRGRGVIGLPNPDIALRELACATLLLGGAFLLARRIMLHGASVAWSVQVGASIGLSLLVAFVFQREHVTGLDLATRVVGYVGLYWLFLGVRWAYHSLRGPQPRTSEQLALDLVRAPSGADTHRARFVVQRRGREVVVPTSDVNWIQAAGREVVLHLGSQSYRLRESMQSVEQSLDPRAFVRVHRSRIVNLDRIREIYPWAYGDFRIVMRDGAVVNFSRHYRSRLEELMG
jgi:LytTr DNA-binding domain